jgi:hypothetical protein
MLLKSRNFGKQVGGDIIEIKKPIYILKQLLFKPRSGIKAFIRDPT